MGRLWRILVVGTAHGLLGATAGLATGLAIGLLSGLLWADMERFISFCCLFGCIVSSFTFAVAGVLWDNGEDVWPFHGGSQPASNRQSGNLPQTAERDRQPSVHTAGRAEEGLRKTTVLFLCTGNSARSQMAEAFLKQQASHCFEVYSAGLAPRPIHPLTFAVMGEIGFDLQGHRAKGLQEFLGKPPVCCAVTVCRDVEPACPTRWPGALRQLAWPFDDPASEDSDADPLAKFRAVRDQIREKISRSLPELIASCRERSALN